MSKKATLIPVEHIENHIYLIRGQKVMLDADLAHLYGVETKYLKRQVNRNRERFPSDFMFRLTQEETNLLRCQIGTLAVNIAIMRAFVKLPAARKAQKNRIYC
ncbi:MAG: ORF6N domain-containing protein [Candidatus Margulisiibacteriota bacterium]